MTKRPRASTIDRLRNQEYCHNETEMVTKGLRPPRHRQKEKQTSIRCKRKINVETIDLPSLSLMALIKGKWKGVCVNFRAGKECRGLQDPLFETSIVHSCELVICCKLRLQNTFVE